MECFWISLLLAMCKTIEAGITASSPLNSPPPSPSTPGQQAVSLSRLPSFSPSTPGQRAVSLSRLPSFNKDVATMMDEIYKLSEEDNCNLVDIKKAIEEKYSDILKNHQPRIQEHVKRWLSEVNTSERRIKACKLLLDILAGLAPTSSWHSSGTGQENPGIVGDKTPKAPALRLARTMSADKYFGYDSKKDS